MQLDTLPDVQLERPANPQHGDFATSLPLRLARATRINPLQLAEGLVKLIPADEQVQRVEAAPPGFINFYLRDSWIQQQVDTVRNAGPEYGNLDLGRGTRMMVEFVSVNPTGPVHVGHTRGAVLGSALANILSAAGYDVTREYYVNDAGSQMEAFYRSVYARYKQALGQQAELPANGYVGEYVAGLAQDILIAEGPGLADLDDAQAIKEIGGHARDRMLEVIRDDLARIGVVFDSWFSEGGLYRDGEYDEAVGLLRNKDYLSQREGALWFNSTTLGDDKDNVVVRSTGEPTYFASDIAYHYNKFIRRGFDGVVNIWGADHQGHVPRIKLAVSALGIDPNRLTVLISQMVTLKRGHRVGPRLQARRGVRHPTRAGRRGGHRRLPLLLPGPQPGDSHGVRLGVGQEGVRRQPGVLRPVRPRSQLGHTEPGPEPGHGLEPWGRHPVGPPQRVGPHPGHVKVP